LQPLALHEESRVALYGTSEFAELVYLGLRELGIEEIDVYTNKPQPDSKFLGMPVGDITGFHSAGFDWVLVADLGKSDGVLAKLLESESASDKLVTFFTDGRSKGGSQ
jgi:hypothetical protein